MSKKNSRHCPALQRDITSKECASDRHSRIPCTADCPFNPFAPENYDDFLLFEKALEAEATARLVKSMTPDASASFLHKAARMQDDPVEFENLLRGEFFHRLGPDGLSFFARWEASGWAGLKNDQRIYYQGHRQLTLMLLEYQGPIDAERAYAIDLLKPNGTPFLLLDRVIAATLPRFTAMLAWHFALPHYERIFGVNLPMRPLGQCTLLETVKAIVQHLGGPDNEGGLIPWLATHYPQFVKAYRATEFATRETASQVFDRTEYHSTWRFSCPIETLIDRCQAAPRLRIRAPRESAAGISSPLASYDVLTDPADLSGFQDNRGADTFATISVTDESIQGSCIGKEYHDQLQAIVESALGEFLSSISVETLELNRVPAHPHDPALVPPRFLKSPRPLSIAVYPRMPDLESEQEGNGLLGDLLTDSYRAFIDATPPELGGLTVQAASALPEHRPAVARIIKAQYHSIDQLCHKKGYSIDIDDLVTKLGFPELIYQQPLQLYTGEDEDVDSEEDEAEDYEEEVLPEFLGLPVLIEQFEEIAGPFSEAEIQSFSQTSAQAALSVDELTILRNSLYSRDVKDLERVVKKSRRQWDLLHETLIDYTEGCLSEKQDRYFSAEILELTYVLFSQGAPATPIKPRRLLYHLIQECRSYQSITALKMSEALSDWVRKTPQPDLSILLAYKLISLTDDRKIDLTPEEIVALVPLLKAILLELCHLPRP